MSFCRILSIALIIGMFLTATAFGASGDLVAPFGADNAVLGPKGDIDQSRVQASASLAPGDPVDFSASLAAGAGYLQGMQADVTEDNAGNGTDGVDETPDDPDDGGWDWATSGFSHTTAASPKNIYGATGLGLYYAYLSSGNAGEFTALTDAANYMAADAGIRSASDLVFLMLYNDLPAVSGTAYADSARAKYDARILTYTSATGFAEYIRDVRGASYSNGIIPWDIGLWVKAAAMLDSRYPGNGYDTDADDMAEVVWQDTYNANPGYFDLVADAGFDPTYDTTDYWWYTLGVTGLIEAFVASGTHTSEIPGLVTILEECQYSNGAISFSYGANTDDEDWQSAAYAVMALAAVDQSGYQDMINRACYWIGATQDPSGGWVYSSGNHYPEIGGECASALSYASTVLNETIVDAGFTSQADVDVYNAANGTSYVYGYDAFGSIQAAIDAVNGSTVYVAAGTYYETLNITLDGLNLIGEDRATVIIDATGLATNSAGIYVANGTDNVTLRGFTLLGGSPGSVPRYGIKFGDGTGCTLEDVTVQNVYRSGVDALGSSNLTITNVTSQNNGGHGLSLVDCNTVTVTDITLSSNGWQNVSVATWGRYTPLGTSGIVFQGTNSFGDLFQLEMGDYNNPGVPPAGAAIITYSTNPADGADVTVQSSDFAFALHGEQDDSPGQARIWFFSTLANASLVPTMAPIGHWTGNDMFIEDLIDPTQYYVTPGGTIQAAVDAADPGDFVNVAAGTYEEQVEVPKDLNIIGEGIGVTTVQSPTSLPLFFTTSANNYPIFYVHDAANVNISQMTVDGLGRGNANYRFYGIAYFNAGGALDHVEVVNIQDTPFSGGQHGNGIYRFDNDGLAYSMAISNCNVHSFQKNGITVNATAAAAVTVDIHDNTVAGEGATDVTAQNGIQVWGDLISGDIYDNVVTGIGYDNTAAATKWAATSILNYYADVNINGNTVSGAHLAVYNIDGAGQINDNNLAIEKIGVYAYGIVATDPPMAVPSGVDSDLLAAPEDGRSSQRSAMATLTVDVSGNTVAFSGPDNSSTWGIEADAGYGADDIAFSATYNTVSGFEVGIVAYNCMSSCATGVFTSAVITNNELLNNDIGVETNEPLVVITDNGILGTIGVQNDLVGTTIDASGNYYNTTDAAAVAAMIVGEVDYTPWLGGGTSASPGFDGDFSTLYIDDNSPQLGTSTRLIEAVGLVSGSTIMMAAGTYAEGPQVVIDKNLTIVGESKSTVTIVPTASTGGSGDARGWFLVKSGMNLDMSEVALDGSGFDIYQGIRHQGSGTLDNVYFSNIVYPGYGGVAVAAFGGTFVTISNSSFANIGRVGALMWVDGAFTGNTYTGKGDGDWLDYAVDMNAGANVSITGNTVSNCTGVASSDGSTSAGFLVTTYYGPGTTANLEGNYISGCTSGLAVGYDASDASTLVVTNGNTFVDNGTGISTTASSAITLTAYGNFFDNTANADDDAGGTWDDGAGTGNCWSDFATNSGFPTNYVVGGDAAAVDNYPNTGDCGVGFDVNDIYYDCSGSFSFHINQGSDITGMEVSSFTIVYPSQLSLVSVVAASGNFSIFTSTFNGSSSDPDTLIVDLSVLSGSQDGPAQLVTVQMSGATDFCSGDMIYMASARYRTADNVDIFPPLGAPITLTADCADPVFTLNSPSSGGYYNTAPVLDFSVSDNCEIDAIYYQVDNCAGGPWTAIATAVGSGTYADAAWAFPDFASVADQASHCVYFKVVDVNGRGNADSCSFSFCFNKDMVAPAPPTDLVAEPGHNNVKLSWTSPGDADLVGIKIQRIAWGDYPHYLVPPLYPANETEGTNVFDGLGDNHVDVLNLNNTTRDVYYYSAFSYDAAGNYSVALSTAKARSTSYWLGDLTDVTTAPGQYDGYVYFGDLARFSIAYGKAQSDPGFDAEADFGPTVTGSPRGIPAPDDSVGFEDLAIFAINFDAVGPTMKVVPYFADGGSQGDHTLVLRSREVDGRQVFGLSVENNTDQLKAFRAVIGKGSKVVLKDVVLSEEIQQTTAPTFHHVTEQENQIIFDFAVLGQGVSIGGSGEFARLEFVSTDGGELNLELLDGVLRDGQNNDLAVVLESIGISSIPNDFALQQNYPNPFNPVTRISLDIPKAAEVRVEVFNMLGQSVRVLLDGYLEAGSYEVEWNGCSNSGDRVASGMYLYRMTAGDYTSTRKMMLLK